MEDYKRHKSDDEENDSMAEKLVGDGFIRCKWHQIYTGDIVKVNRGEFIPADLLIIFTSNEKPECYIETKNLDGETNLKIKTINEKFRKIIRNENEIGALTNSIFSYEKPNPYLYTFGGSVRYRGNDISVDNNNLVLRGCSLRNTNYIIGAVAYTSHQTKIMMNSIKAKSKKSDLENQMNFQIILVFSILVMFCSIASGIYCIWYHNHKDKILYLELGD